MPATDALRERCRELVRELIPTTVAEQVEAVRAGKDRWRAKMERALLAAARAGMEEAARMADSEPEPEGPRPVVADPVELTRATVRATRKSIGDEIRAAEGLENERTERT